MRFIPLCAFVFLLASPSAVLAASGADERAGYAEPDFSKLGMTADDLVHVQSGPAHERLEFLIGTFSSSGGMSADAGQDARKLSGNIESRWVLGGRFVETRGAYDWDGQPIRTLRYLGYDSLTQEYLWIDMDNWRVFPVVKRGIADGESGVMTFTYEYPQVGGPALRIMEVIRPRGPDAFEIENIQFLPDGRFETRSRTQYRRIVEGEPAAGEQ